MLAFWTKGTHLPKTVLSFLLLHYTILFFFIFQSIPLATKYCCLYNFKIAKKSRNSQLLYKTHFIRNTFIGKQCLIAHEFKMVQHWVLETQDEKPIHLKFQTSPFSCQIQNEISTLEVPLVNKILELHLCPQRQLL